ncbi:CinA family protein [Candidatus Spongiihabitans sp.]|uniref:CinA family protein n=1 Tax=Candidatus Spongiihabitans sp. TaxID=3101308 RepID=UPI003C7B130C
MHNANTPAKSVAIIGAKLNRLGRSVTTVESCTGGGIAYALTALAGSSNWFERGYVTYSNTAKSAMVGVSYALLEKYGAVSNEVAEAMAVGGLKHADADYALSVTGIAGPDGGSKDKPVGTVCFGWTGPDNYVQVEKIIFRGNRDDVRSQAIAHSLAGLLRILENEHSANNQYK